MSDSIFLMGDDGVLTEVTSTAYVVRAALVPPLWRVTGLGSVRLTATANRGDLRRLRPPARTLLWALVVYRAVIPLELGSLPRHQYP
jgi:hypothetical protein